MSGRKTMLAVGAVAGLIVGGSGVAVAGVVASDGVITACVTSSGTLRVPGTAQPTANPSPTPTTQTELAPAGEPGPEVCAAGERVITWNQQGPAGPTGPAGPAGPTGPEGPNPFDGQFQGTLSALLHPRTAGSYIGKCLRGQIAVSGGYEITDLYNEAAVPDVIVSKAALVFDADGKPRSYEVRAKNPTDRLLNVYSRVHCVPE
ncbi:hypothetical protein ACIBQ6_01060 [Nonomuraea sp. NPDC049655]|uniref:hypothetical protein n=1 Tax=Nonomuraea sp. NPDC049655 TaxID=3364355 RepID=UPI00378EFAB3